VVVSLPIYLLLLLPFTLVTRLICRLTGIRAASVKPLEGITLDTPHEIKDLAQRKYDLVLFGATGFTGKLAAQYLAKNYANKLRWAIAGRNLEGLKTLRKELIAVDGSLTELPLLECDATKPELLRAVVSETRVIATTVGPFTLYGTPLVSLCAQLGTSYCDITGELDWVRKIIHTYHMEATKSGARIISLAGHDCVPWDLTTMKIANKLQERGESLSEIELFDETRASASGGTLETIMLIMNHPQKGNYPFDPLVTDLSGKKSDNRFEIKNATFLSFSKTIKKWIGPFVMASANANCVRRSNAVLNYSKKLVYKEALVYPDFFSGFVAFFFFRVSSHVFVGITIAVVIEEICFAKTWKWTIEGVHGQRLPQSHCLWQR